MSAKSWLKHEGGDDRGSALERRVRGPAIFLLAFMCVGGCSRARLDLDDVVVIPERPTLMRAYVERHMLLDLRNGVEEVDVTFYDGQQAIQTLTTDDEGVVLLLRELEGGDGPPAVRVEATVDERPLVAEAQVFVWRDDRLILLVDIDDTISETDYLDLIFTKVDRGSQPIAGSQEVLRELAQDYHIAYFTARPRLAVVQTRRWLRMHGYPPGPLYTAPTLSEVTDQDAFKQGFIALIKSCWPNLLVGIGDKSADREAYTTNALFAVIRGADGSVEAGETVVVLPDWEAIGEFFRARRSALADPVRVRADLSVLAPAADAGRTGAAPND